ncbi:MULTISPECIES: DUF7019 family protein [unclassified Streptomyces]|uniref:DUF7019 family protein n=1 Tax=unclassified Streptomyces TaxID=2593676 RepID=UPI0004C98D75|nr:MULTISPECIES: SAVMC3_10250 family protein [unclassified Streptomyces]
MSLHHCLCISDTKADMLLPQIGADFDRKHATDVGADLKFVSVKRSVESATANRVTPLERVPRCLDGSGDVVTVDVPGPYVRGRLPMRWEPSATGRASLVHFGGSTGRSPVGLGGASGHVPGAPAAAVTAGTDPVFAPSTTPGLLSGLATALADDSATVPPDALASVHLVNPRGVEEQMESLERCLSHGPSPNPELDAHEGMTVLPGSPLLVALSD